MANRAGAFIEPGAADGAETTRTPVAVSSLAASAACAGFTGRVGVERAEIDRHGANVLVGQACEFLHHRRHRPRGNAVKTGFAGSQIGEEFILAPGDRRMRQRGQRRRFPALRETAREIGAGLFGAQRVARRMAGAAMAEALDQIGAAIPDRRFGRIGFERLGLVKQRVPSRHQRTQVERKRQRVCGVIGPHRRLRHQIGIERLQVGIARPWRNADRGTPDRDAGRRDGCPRAWRARRQDRTTRRSRSRRRA